MKNIIVFGATGTVGAYTILELVKRGGYRIIAVGRREDNGFFQNIGVTYYKLDISNKEAFNTLPDLTFDAVLHLAGPMPSKMEGYDPMSYIQSIMGGTLNVMDFVRKTKSKKIIFTQTRADSSYLMGSKEPVPADIQKKFPLKGDHSIYTICKNAAVDIIDHYFHEYNISRFILRLPTIYAYHPNPYFYVNGKKKKKAYMELIHRAINGEQIEIWGDPDMEKEIVYVKDLVEIIRLAIENDGEGGVFNVGRGVGESLESQIKGIIEVFDVNGKCDVVYRPEMPNARQFVHDISKTQSVLGFSSQYTYLQMLTDLKEEMNNNTFAKLWGQ